MYFDPALFGMWYAGQQTEILDVKRKRCGGCGQFLPKDMTDESWVLMNGKPYHVREKCLTKGVENLRKTFPDWDWPEKHYPDMKEVIK